MDNLFNEIMKISDLDELKKIQHLSQMMLETIKKTEKNCEKLGVQVKFEPLPKELPSLEVDFDSTKYTHITAKNIFYGAIVYTSESEKSGVEFDMDDYEIFLEYVTGRRKDNMYYHIVYKRIPVQQC